MVVADGTHRKASTAAGLFETLSGVTQGKRITSRGIAATEDEEPVASCRSDGGGDGGRSDGDS